MSASLALGVVGGVVGSFFGMPQLGFMVGSLVGGLLFPPKGPDGPRLDDLKPQASEYGRPIPLVYGTVALGGNVVWSSEYVEESSEEGGGCGEPSFTTYSYFGNFAVMICVGEKSLGRIWAGPEKRLIWDGTRLEGEESGAELRFYSGTEDQLPDALIESYEGVGNVPAWRGWCYVVLEHFPLVNDGNSIPFLTVEVGNIATTPLELGIAAFPVQIITTDTKAIFLIDTGFTGKHVIVRNLADHSYVSHYDGASLSLSGAENLFHDPDRNRIVKVAGGLYAMDLDTGDVESVASIPIHVASGATSPGTYGRAGMYHDGLYVCLAYANSGTSTGRYTITAVDPDTLDAVWTYTGDVGDASGVCGPMYHVNDADSFIFLHGREGNLRKVPFSADFTSTTWGACATASGEYCKSQQDPNTGLVWSYIGSGTGTETDPTVTVYVNDLTTGTQVYTEACALTGTFTMPSQWPFIFTPDTVVMIMSKTNIAWGDYFLTWDATPTFRIDQVGVRAWVSGYQATQGFYSPLDGYVWVYRQDISWVNRSTGLDNDLSQMAMGSAQNATYPDTGYYVGARGMTVDGDPLSDVVADLSERAGFESAEYDFSEIAGDEVDGYAISSQTTVREAITALQPAYFFDLVESGGTVKAVKRGGAVVATIPAEDLGAYEAGAQPIEPMDITRGIENALPRRLTVEYLLAATNYSKATKYAARLAGSSQEESGLSLPLVLSDTKAQEIAEVNLHGAWVARLPARFSLPYKYAYLEPTDCVSIDDRRWLIKKITQAGTIFKVEAVSDGIDVYSPDVIVTETVPIDQEVFETSDTIMELM